MPVSSDIGALSLFSKPVFQKFPNFKCKESCTPAIRFSKGLHDLGNGQYAYLQPSGTWGFSNAGLIVDGEESLLVDTLFDERLTGEMLDVMRDATGLGASDITTLVNTHAHGDHT